MLPKNYNFEMHKSIWRIISIQNQVGRKVRWLRGH